MSEGAKTLVVEVLTLVMFEALGSYFWLFFCVTVAKFLNHIYFQKAITVTVLLE